MEPGCGAVKGAWAGISARRGCPASAPSAWGAPEPSPAPSAVSPSSSKSPTRVSPLPEEEPVKSDRTENNAA